VLRVGHTLDDPIAFELVDDALDALPRLPHGAGDLRDRRRMLPHRDGAEHLPAGGG
jgi:hypothetical protein